MQRGEGTKHTEDSEGETSKEASGEAFCECGEVSGGVGGGGGKRTH